MAAEGSDLRARARRMLVVSGEPGKLCVDVWGEESLFWKKPSAFQPPDEPGRCQPACSCSDLLREGLWWPGAGARCVLCCFLSQHKRVLALVQQALCPP